MRRLIVGLVVVSALALITAATGLAATAPNWLVTGSTAPLPANAEPGALGNRLTDISCPSAGNCAAVGYYADQGGVTRGWLLDDRAGAWQPATGATGPTGATGAIVLSAVSCAAAGECAAIGNGQSATGATGPVVVDEAGGAWQPAVPVTLPAGGSPSSPATLDAVDCGAPGDCAAVGTYRDGSGDELGLLVSETGGTWTPGVAAQLPADAATNPGAAITSVSCPAAGTCTAVGDYDDANGVQHAVILTETAGTWQPGAVPALPAGTPSDEPSGLAQIACPAAGACSAVGSYGDAGSSGPLLLTQQSGQWVSTSTTGPAGVTGAHAGPLACGAPGSCAEVGGYGSTRPTSCCQTPELGLLLDQTAGIWSPETIATAPADADETTPESLAAFAPLTLTSDVACAAGDCTTAGAYETTGGIELPLFINDIDGAWQQGVSAPVPNGTTAIQLSAISCPAPGSCTAVGTDIDGTAQGVIFQSTPGTAPTVALTAPKVAGPGIPVSPSAASATLAAGQNPTGTIAFSVLGPSTNPPSSCAAGATALGATAVAGNGAYAPPSGFTPASGGNYWWYARYSGDQANTPAGASCGIPLAETVVRPPATLTLTVPATSDIVTTIPPGMVTATLASAVKPTGTAAFTVFGPSSEPPERCDTGGTDLGTTTVTRNGQLHPQYGFTPTSNGRYWWYASWSGDTGNLGVDTTCGSQMAETTVDQPAYATGTRASGNPRSGLLTIRTIRVSRISVRMRVACLGNGRARCRVKVRLSTLELLRRGQIIAIQAGAAQPRGVRFAAVPLSHVMQTVQARHSARLTLTLDRVGRRLLQTRRSLPAQLIVASNGRTITRRPLTFYASSVTTSGHA